MRKKKPSRVLKTVQSLYEEAESENDKDLDGLVSEHHSDDDDYNIQTAKKVGKRANKKVN